MTASGDFRFRDIALAAYGPSIVSAIGHGAVMPVLALRARELGADVSTAASSSPCWASAAWSPRCRPVPWWRGSANAGR